MVFKHSDLLNTLHYGEFYALPIITQVKIPHHPISANPGQPGVYSVPGIWEIINEIVLHCFPLSRNQKANKDYCKMVQFSILLGLKRPISATQGMTYKNN